MDWTFGVGVSIDVTVASAAALSSPWPFVIRLRVGNIPNRNIDKSPETQRQRQQFRRIPFPFLGFSVFSHIRLVCVFFPFLCRAVENVLLIRSLEMALSLFTVCIPLVRIVYLTTSSIILLFIWTHLQLSHHSAAT